MRNGNGTFKPEKKENEIIRNKRKRMEENCWKSILFSFINIKFPFFG